MTPEVEYTLSRWQLEAEARAVSPERSRIEAEVDAKLNAILGGKKESEDHALILLAVRRGARLVCWVSGLLLAALLLIRLIFWFYDLMGLR